MNNIVSTVALCTALLGGPAFAADLLSRKAPPPTYIAPAPVAAWTGFYVGLNAGGTFAGGANANTAAWDQLDTGATASGATFAASAAGRTPIKNDGFIGGGQVGYNFQFNNIYVAGVEADIQGLTGGAPATSTGVGLGPTGIQAVTTTQLTKSLDYIGTVRGRIGYLVTPTLLIYGAGGLAYGGANLSANYSSVDAAGIMPPG